MRGQWSEIGALKPWGWSFLGLEALYLYMTKMVIIGSQPFRVTKFKIQPEQHLVPSQCCVPADTTLVFVLHRRQCEERDQKQGVQEEEPRKERHEGRWVGAQGPLAPLSLSSARPIRSAEA